MDKGLIVDSAGLLSGTFAKLQKRQQLDKLRYVSPSLSLSPSDCLFSWNNLLLLDRF